MNKNSLLSLIAVFFVLILASSQSFGRKPTADEMLFNSAQGRDFWFAIPPNEADGQPLGNTDEVSIDVYVTSSKNTKVTLEIPGLNYKLVKPVEAMKVTTFTTPNQETSFAWEIRESEKVMDMAIHVYADQPISVYVMNTRKVTSDGWLGIPTSACGTDYMHLAYYDFFEQISSSYGERRGGGFIICATEDRTTCKINLKGVGGAYGKTLGGHKIGDVWTVNLNKGQLYCVMGDGTSRGQFDISGSTVHSNKPVSFISFHKRTIIPSYDMWNGRDNLIESLPPISAWGKKYVTCELKRNNHGDFFRIIASQDSTHFTVKWYDPKSGQMIGQRNGTLKASEFREYVETYVPRFTTNTEESIKGVSVWTADKPVLVMQYSYSADWDNAAEFDPFMMLVVPEEQYIPGTVFQTPAEGSSFNTNWFNIVAVGDTNDPTQAKLKSIMLDGKAVAAMVPGFVFNNIPTTNMYWAKIMMTPGAHRISGDTKFGGYIYGFSDFNSYGWPAATALNKIDECDTLPPVLTVTDTCGDYSIRATEFRNGKADDNPRQIDQGVAEVELIEPPSFNFKLDLIDSLYVYPPPKDYHFRLHVVDMKKDAFAYYVVTDKYGNSAIDSLVYVAAKLSVKPDSIDFGRVRLKTSKQMLAVLKNDADSAIKITEVKLAIGKDYRIAWGSAPPEFVLAAGDTHHIWIEYNPTVESLKPELKDRDTLLVSTECPGFSWPIMGRGVIPRIKVEDWDAGTIVANSKVCKTSQTGTGLRIDNPGTDTLVIDDITNVADPFVLSNPFTPPLKIRIPEGEFVYLQEICYEPKTTGPSSIDVTFKNNSDETDPTNDGVSNWKGNAVKPGPYITNYDWHEQRVLVDSTYYVSLMNGGSSDIKVTGVDLGNPSQNDFKIMGTIPAINGFVSLAPDTSTDPKAIKEIKINVKFTPQSEFAKSNTVVPTFEDGNIQAGSVVGKLDGFGILPKIEVIGYEFNPPILKGTTHPTTGYVTIKSTSETADLFVKSVTWNANPGDFTWTNGSTPVDTVIKRGETAKLPVTFKAIGLNDRIAPFVVMSDAATGPERFPLIPATDSVIGHVYEVGIYATNIDYGNVILCDQPEKTFEIGNTSSTNKATIYDMVLDSGDTKAFSITSPRQVVIDKEQKILVNVKFTPDKVGPFSARIVIYSDIDTIYARVKGVGYVVPMNFSLQKHTESENLRPGNDIPMGVTVSSKDYPNAKVSHFSIEMTYNTNWIKFNPERPVEQGVSLPGTWKITPKEEKINETQSRLTIEAESNSSFVSGDGAALTPHFIIMLNENTSFEPFISAINMFDRTKCVPTTGDTGRIVLNTCEVRLRNVKFFGSDYSLQSIEPNPVSGNNISIKYSLGLKTSTRIEIYNTLGNLVKTVVDAVQDPGAYEAIVPTDNMTSGSYTIKMVSGPFSGTQKLVIAK